MTVFWYYGHWDQFGTTVDSAVELLTYFWYWWSLGPIWYTWPCYIIVTYICWLSVINSVQHLTMHVIRESKNYFVNDGHWNQFGTTLDHAIELLSYFDNDGHWALGLIWYHCWPCCRIAYLFLILMVTGTNLVHWTMLYYCYLFADSQWSIQYNTWPCM